MKDNGIWYFVANFITYILLYVLCLTIIIQFVENAFIRVIASLVLLLSCGYIEEKVLSQFVNNFIEKLLQKCNR